MNRNEYYLDLSELKKSPSLKTASELQMRAARHSDVEALSELMIDAFRGTIDYAGETLEEASSEVQAYLTGQRGGKALLTASRLCFQENRLAAACLVGEWDKRKQPLIAYVMTRADCKKQGLGRCVLLAALWELALLGRSEVRAVITGGNRPSERLFAGLGFKRVL